MQEGRPIWKTVPVRLALTLVLVAVLLGAEFNADVERGRQIAAGLPAEEEPFLEPRDTRKMRDTGNQKPGAVNSGGS
ncbi:MAG: ribonuclease [Frankiales bacterium]|nr:ribonuclease [Frankiales bacterium]